MGACCDACAQILRAGALTVLVAGPRGLTWTRRHDSYAPVNARRRAEPQRRPKGLERIGTMLLGHNARQQEGARSSAAQSDQVWGTDLQSTISASWHVRVEARPLRGQPLEPTSTLR